MDVNGANVLFMDMKIYSTTADAIAWKEMRTYDSGGRREEEKFRIWYTERRMIKVQRMREIERRWMLFW